MVTQSSAAGPAADAASSAASAPAASRCGRCRASVVVTARRLNAARSEIETQTGASTYTITARRSPPRPAARTSSMNQVLLQAPDVVQDSFGQLHVRGRP